MSQDTPQFGRATAAWFSQNFAAATPVQQRGWPVIGAGGNSLLIAPTGSGKTLAAFLWCLDRLLHRPPAELTDERDGERLPGYDVIYVSPLKALVYDVERNLRAPLRGIRSAAAGLGVDAAPVRVDVRTGDTPQKARRQQKKSPGDILITTPESLYLLLGSAAREGLRRVRTVIVDEIHALAPTKRGAHLALTLERLSALADHEPQRIGLSATVRPPEEIARFLGGDRPVEIVDAHEAPNLELEIVVPLEDMSRPALGAAARRGGAVLAQEEAELSTEERTSIWPAVYPRLLELVQAHRSTIIFVNSRRLCERMAQALNELAGSAGSVSSGGNSDTVSSVAGDLVRAHHGSVSHDQRTEIEEALKSGNLRGIVATSSLELGIDMGAVDLVVQVESPGSVARGLQRVGRAGHQVGAPSRGRIFPKFRGDLLEAAVLSERMHAGAIEPIRVPVNALDVLSQQLVAACSLETWAVDDLARLVRRAHPYRELGDGSFTAVLDMLSGRYDSDLFAEIRPLLVWDRTADTVTGRRAARSTALLNAGTIPDRGTYAVHLGPDGPRVGELDEEMVFESRAGEVFLLGATSWRIEEIGRDRVIVSPAPGEPGKMPFWRGEGPGRPVDLGRALGAFVRTVGEAPVAEARQRLIDSARLDGRAADNLLAYLDEQREATGALPTDRTIVVERFRDELGDWRVCLLTPFGGRVHAPWALALERTLTERAGFEIQALWSDDGVVLRLADSPDLDEDEVPAVDWLMPDPDEVEDLVVEQLQSSALFAARFRESAARALLLTRRRHGQRTPLWAQRIRAANLLATVQRHPSFPIVLETYRECLRDVFDLPSLREILRCVRSRSIRVVEAETASASPFARSLVFAYVAAYLYEGDAPLAERKAQALALDRNLLRELLGQDELRDLLDPAVIDELEDELQRRADGRRARHEDDVHDLLRALGDLTPAEVAARATEDPTPWLATLEDARRVFTVRVAGERRVVAAEDIGRYRDALGLVPPPGVPAAFLEPVPAALEDLARRWARTHCPFRARELAARLGLTEAQLLPALELLQSRGQLVRGAFRPDGVDEEWCDPEILRRLRRRTLARLRAEVAPVDAAALARFLPGWHGVGGRGRGLERLLEVTAQLEGLALPVSALESRILPARVSDFRPRMLDELGALGAVVWVGRGALGARDGRVALYRRERVPLLLAAPPAEWDGAPESVAALLGDDGDGDQKTGRPLARVVWEHLRTRGASFFSELHAACGRAQLTPTTDELLSALWDLVWAGIVTNDTFHPLRSVGAPAKKKKAGGRGRIGLGAFGPTSGRWSCVAELFGGERPTDTQRLHANAVALLDRYGVVGRAMAAHEELPGGFSSVYPVLRTMEEVGRVRRGLFVDGLTGSQFAQPGAVDRLRAARASDGEGQGGVRVLAAVDPAQPWGALLPWPRRGTVGDGQGDDGRSNGRGARQGPRRVPGADVILVEGVPIFHVEPRGRRLHTFPGADDEVARDRAVAALKSIATTGRRRSLRIDRIDGAPALESPLSKVLEGFGFARDYRGLLLLV